jgi:hypothetical protein
MSQNNRRAAPTINPTKNSSLFEVPFKKKAAQAEEKRDLPAILLSIKDGWDEDRINALAAAPIEEYRKAFKSHSGADLRRMLSNAFQFDRITNASNAMREISRRAREALKLIGGESAINARRVRRFGVKLGGDGEEPNPQRE